MANKDIPFILVLISDNAGCGYHRCISPAKYLSQNGIALTNIVLGHLPIDQLQKAKPTSIIMQRQVDHAQIEHIKEMRKTLGEGPSAPKFIWEIDDYITNVPYDSVHEPFQAPAKEVEENIRECLNYCDWATVPTKPLKDWLQTIKPGFEVKVIPNLLEELDSKELAKIEPKKSDEKSKIGWMGGISHVGDLHLIEPAISALHKENIKWQFMGLRPEGDFGRADISFHPGTPPQEYIKTITDFGLELVLAPLEDHPFNDAKSNLRLIQAGVQGAAVIASPSYGYKDQNPPVFAYPTNSDEWIQAIRKWLDLPEKEKIYWRSKMRNWARQWGVHNNLSKLAEAWGVNVHPIKSVKNVSNKFMVFGDEHNIFLSQSENSLCEFAMDINFAIGNSLKEGMPLVFIRSGTVIDADNLSRMKQTMKQNDAASVCGLSNDGIFGVDFLSNSQNPQLSGLDSNLYQTINKIVKKSKLNPRPCPFPLGPVVMLNPDYLAKIPFGKSFLDWGFLQSLSGVKNLLDPQVFNTTSTPDEIPDPIWMSIRRININETKSTLLPEEKLILEARCIREQAIHIASQNPNDTNAWVSIFGGSRFQSKDVARLKLGDQQGLERAKKSEVKWIFWEVPSIKVMENADGELENTGNLENSGVVYCDAIGPQNSTCFRPHTFDQEWFKAWDYITGCFLVRSELWEWGAPVGRGELFRRLLELMRDGQKFSHCNRVLCTEEDTPEDETRAQSVQDIFPDFSARPNIRGLLEVKRKLKGLPKVSIIMLTSGKTWILRPALATLLRRTTYKGDWEIILGRSGPVKGNPMELSELKDPRIKYVELGEEKFNWSALNNKLVKEYASGEYVIFLNDDCRVLDKTWMEEMLGYAQESDISYVGLRLTFPHDGSIQHVGVYCNAGHTGHIHKQWQGHMPGYWGYARATHECAAVTGACLAIQKSKFEELGYFPENYAYNFGDVAACINARRKGYRVVCVCPSEMQHAESCTRPVANSQLGLALLRAESNILKREYPESDPYWNPSLKIAIHPSRLMANGFNFEILNWDMAEDGINEMKRVLLLNCLDQTFINKINKLNTKIIVGVAEHGRLMLIRPGLSSAPAIELRDKSMVSLLLRELGVSDVIAEIPNAETKYIKECLA